MSSEEALAALLPLLENRAEHKMGAVQGLTGTISRGDGITIKVHVEAFETEADKNLYRMLGLHTLEIRCLLSFSFTKNSVLRMINVSDYYYQINGDFYETTSK